MFLVKVFFERLSTICYLCSEILNERERLERIKSVEKQSRSMEHHNTGVGVLSEPEQQVAPLILFSPFTFIEQGNNNNSRHITELPNTKVVIKR